MSVSDEYLDFVMDQFEGMGELRAKRMFGGVGIYCDGWVFAILADDELYLKADDVNRADYERQGLKPFTYRMKNGRSGSMSYYPLPAGLLDEKEELMEWSRKSIDAARRAKI